MAYSNNDLSRFLDAQNKLYLTAFSEISKGKKETHWMWFIFPQVKGLGKSDTANLYAINDLKAELNELDESDFVKSSNQECNARFLKWLISKDHKEIIKDLKILTGASKKIDESFVYDHFPKSEHLLLTPKPYFEV